MEKPTSTAAPVDRFVMLVHTPIVNSIDESRILYMLCCLSRKMRRQMKSKLRCRYSHRNFSREGTAIMNYLLGYSEEVSPAGKQRYESLMQSINQERH